MAKSKVPSPADNGQSDAALFPQQEASRPPDRGAGPLEAAPPSASPEAAPDPFSPESLRLPDTVGALAVTKLVTVVSVRRPDKAWWIRTHPDPGFRLVTAVFEDDQGDLYLIRPDLRTALALEPTVSIRLLITSVTRQGQPFLWPVRLPGPDGKIDPWNASARQAAERATSSWVRVMSDRTAGCYNVLVAPADLGPPIWPELSFREILRTAFKDRMIESLEHPALKRLRGEE